MKSSEKEENKKLSEAEILECICLEASSILKAAKKSDEEDDCDRRQG